METKNTDANASEPTTEPTAATQPVIEAQSEPQTNTDENTVNKPSSQSKPAPWGIIFTLFLLLLLAFASIAGGYYLYQQLQAQKAESAALNQKLQS
ncbi:uroporphyrinogen-III C-methyltransferase, partial [Shewanella sp. 0m-11]